MPGILPKNLRIFYSVLKPVQNDESLFHLGPVVQN